MYDDRSFISDSKIDEVNNRNEARHKKMPETQIKKVTSRSFLLYHEGAEQLSLYS